MANHPFLQFNTPNRRDIEARSEFERVWERRGLIAQPRGLNWATLQALNQEERLQGMMYPDSRKLFDIIDPVYLELTVEFLATFKYKKPALRERPDFTSAGKWGMQFRLGGVWHDISVAEFGVRMGIYTRQEIEASDFNELTFRLNDNEKTDLWRELTGLHDYDPQRAKASRIRDPLLRYMHCVIANSVCGRKDSQGNCPTPDLLFLLPIATHTQVNHAALMAQFFLTSKGRSPGSEIHGGRYITALARGFGVSRRNLTKLFDGESVDMDVLRRMGLLHELPSGAFRLRDMDGRVWDPEPDEDDDDEDDDDEDDDDSSEDGDGGEADDVEMPAPIEVLEPPPQYHEPPPQYQPYHEPPPQQQQQTGFGDWPPGPPPFDQFYGQFRELCVYTREAREETRAAEQAAIARQEAAERAAIARHEEMRRQQTQFHSGVYEGFTYLFGGLNSYAPDHFGADYPQFPYQTPGEKRSRGDDAGPSRSRRDDD